MKNEVTMAYWEKMKNKIYGLLCEVEKNGEWEQFLAPILCALLGIDENRKTINYYILLSKLSSLRFLRYEYFRKTIFECIGLIDKL